LYDYQRSGRLIGESFESLLYAAMRRADSDNFKKLAAAFPAAAQELEARFNAVGGILDIEQAELAAYHSNE
jgi:hypothetical protein